MVKILIWKLIYDIILKIDFFYKVFSEFCGDGYINNEYAYEYKLEYRN
jgi:hypothetical protein